MAGHGSSVKAILYAFLANLGIGIIKTGAAIYTGSGSMLAEAIHSYADTGNQMLLFLGLKRAQMPATPEHPLGKGKAVYFWSFIVAILLFSMGGLFSIYEGVHKLEAEEELSEAWIALVVLGISIILEAGSLAGAIKEINTRKGDRSLFSWMRESRDAELIVVFGEDMAAIAGLVLAFLFILAAQITGNPVFDAMGSIVIGTILLIVSVFVATRVKAMLIGRSADPKVVQGIEEILLASPNVKEVYNLITIQLGPDVMVAAKIRLEEALSITQAVDAINTAERSIKEKIPGIRWLFVEPDYHK
jgi:cation diffusion facilitator family transporter